MKNLRLLKRLLFAIVAFLLSTTASFANDFEVDGIYYDILSSTEKTVEVTYQGRNSNSYSNEYTGSVTIPETVTYSGTIYSVTSIGSSAFWDCSGLTSVTIPNSVTEIGNYAFSACSGLTSINVESGNSKYDSRDNCNAIIETGTNTLIVGCQNTMIPNSVTSIGFASFYNCTGLKSVTIPNSVTSIGSSAFKDCSGLTSVTIPNSVTSIGDYAFSGCSGLTSVTIPNSVTSIGQWAFSGCSGLTSVTIPNSVTSIGAGAFKDCSGLTSVIIPNSVPEIGQSAFYNCSGLTSVTIPNSVTSIGNYAFYNCSGLTSVTIPNSVTSIGGAAFYGCSGLTSVSIPNSVTSIGNYTFYNCSGLTSVTIGNSVTSIGKGAFSGCSGLTEVNYNAKNLLNVGESTNLSYAKIIIVGEDVETIPAGIIDSSAATTIISKNTIPPVCDSNAFSSVEKSKCTLYVPSASFMDYWSADVWKEFTNIKPFTEVSEISLGSENYTIKVGESLQLETTIAPSNASISDLIWTSSNPEVATVSSSGKVVGIKPGEATITARTIDGSNLTASCTVTVDNVLAESIKLSQTEVELAPYETVVLTYTILPENTTNKSVTWSSSDESIATFKVNNDGSATVLMLKEDLAIITATTIDGSNLSASCIVGYNTTEVNFTNIEEVAVTVEVGKIVVKNVTGIVTIYNLNGIAVASETANGNEVRFDNIQPGVYIVVVNNKSVKVVL